MLAVKDIRKSKAFYERALACLGMKAVMEWGDGAGFGKDGVGELFVTSGAPFAGPVHVAFQAQDRAVVDAFHAAALAAGGEDNGVPGLREQYHPHYYGAFVRDPDGHNIEVVCHKELG